MAITVQMVSEGVKKIYRKITDAIVKSIWVKNIYICTNWNWNH